MAEVITTLKMAEARKHIYEELSALERMVRWYGIGEPHHKELLARLGKEALKEGITESEFDKLCAHKPLYDRICDLQDMATKGNLCGLTHTRMLCAMEVEAVAKGITVEEFKVLRSDAYNNTKKPMIPNFLVTSPDMIM